MMKTIFDDDARREFIIRLNKLNAETYPLWGKMSAPQMVKHCRLWEEMIHQNQLLKGSLIGRVIGRLILKKVLQTPDFRKNSPTVSQMIVTSKDINFADERRQLIASINSYPQYNFLDNSFIHPFFGKMTREQIGRLVYLHMNHHLNQFGV
jgi:hypothetical protein